MGPSGVRAARHIQPGLTIKTHGIYNQRIGTLVLSYRISPPTSIGIFGMISVQPDDPPIHAVFIDDKYSFRRLKEPEFRWPTPDSGSSQRVAVHHMWIRSLFKG